ncbi:xanthine dehydrogenase family protein molybdopterin-binding subunit [Mesorhizobium sp. B1-1-8]|uniref:xanthine dehydrogenase family protein molybdopterin-binding subunit n=1 Tax=Mesorhizobium sp. B1-1-8 TaxID=2589976 RepID=UPI00112C7C4D|nr:xanthine dehydrogenase family protein molybdopterin-binding subunit [Mesorhizobium sp. B1-1-8]UCI05173.1 xanthine dehydrogenase family protein molybdopterin-binding subunit [Mesorhizobium sp. B1-1-8]
MGIGEPLARIDGPLKVTGSASYTADLRAPNMLHAVFVTAPLPAGKVIAIDSSDALAEPGVFSVLTHHDMPQSKTAIAGPPFAHSFLPLQDEEIRHEGQPIAIVLGETLEAAAAGAEKVNVSIAPAIARIPVAPLWSNVDRIALPPKNTGYFYLEPEFAKGEADRTLALATQHVEAVYSQPPRHHNPMEPSAVLAQWEGDALTLYASTQHVYALRMGLAALFGIPSERVRVISKHTGGAFGVKGLLWPQEALAALAAKIVQRPVRVVLSRADMYSFLGYQPRIVQKVGVGSDDKGVLAAITHHVVNLTTVTDDFIEFATEASKSLYATPSMLLSQRAERAHVAMPTAMRAPGEGPGMWALESAMDELAVKLGIDPLDLRLINYAETEPSTGAPWSSKKLREAYEEGARLFGWRERAGSPRRDGDWIIGQGMASCFMGTFRFPSRARIVLRRDATAVIETGTQDIGTGIPTIFPQIASDVLGLAASRIELRLGDTELPEAGPTYGSSSTMGVGAAVLAAAQEVRDRLARLANLPPDEATMLDGRIGRIGATETQSVGEVMQRAGETEIAGLGIFDPTQHGTGYAMRTFGAVFVEVGVDPALGLLRLRRAVGSYSVGRIVNPRTARSQLLGGIVWGWGMAAMEQSAFEPTLGRFLSKNLAGVAIPVNADIPSEITVHFVDEIDEKAGPIGGKGIGELGATGVAAAVANAVFHATGKRIRDLPITPDKLIG